MLCFRSNNINDLMIVILGIFQFPMVIILQVFLGPKNHSFWLFSSSLFSRFFSWFHGHQFRDGCLVPWSIILEVSSGSWSSSSGEGIHTLSLDPILLTSYPMGEKATEHSPYEEEARWWDPVKKKEGLWTAPVMVHWSQKDIKSSIFLVCRVPRCWMPCA